MPTPYSSLSSGGSGLGTKAAEAWHTCPGPQAVGNVRVRNTLQHCRYIDITDLLVVQL